MLTKISRSIIRIFPISSIVILIFFCSFLYSQDNIKNYKNHSEEIIWQPEEKVYKPNELLNQVFQNEITTTESMKGTERLANETGGGAQNPGGEDSTIVPEAVGTFSASAGGSDYSTVASWSGWSNPCFIPWSHSYTWWATHYYGTVNSVTNSGSTPSSGGVTSYPGPSRTTYYDFQYCYDGLACDDCYAIVSTTATTAALKSPTNFTASNDSSFQYVYLSWSKGTDIPDYHPDTGERIVRYYIYRNSVYFASTNNLNYTATITPGQTDTWGVVTHTNYGGLSTTSAMVTSTGSTIPMKAADGKYNSRVKIEWGDLSHVANEIRIMRGSDELGVVSNNSKTFYDDNAVPGKISEYSVIPINNNGIDLAAGNDYGYARPNGRIDGTVTTRQNAGVADVEISAIPTATDISTCLQFDGSNDFVALPTSLIANISDKDAITIEYWFAGSQLQSPVRIQSSSEYIVPGWSSSNPVHIISTDGGTSNGLSVGDEAIIEDGNWHHIAMTWQRNTVNGYKSYLDGVLVAQRTSADVNLPTFTNIISYLGAYNGTSEFLQGKLDEVRIWNIARDSSAIVSYMHTLLKGNETGLIAYYTFDDYTRASSTIAGDFAEGGGNHGTISGATYLADSVLTRSRSLTDVNGDYLIKNLYYGDSREFTVSPAKANHGFNPGFRNRTLEINVPTVSGVSFTDTTAFTLKGRIYQAFAGDTCFVPDVEMLIDGIFLLNKTNNNGEFQLTIEEPGVYTITPRFENHTFSPSEYTITVEEDIFGLDFTDTKMDTLSGKVLASCNIYIGRADLRIWNDKNPAQAIDTTIRSNDVSGYYEIVLPARTYNIEMTNFIPANPTIVSMLDVLAYFSAPYAVDLTTENAKKNFIYRKPPSIKITGYDEFTCAPFDIVPVMEMGVTYPLQIEVYENFNLDTCLADTGYIIIYDGVGGDPSKPDTFSLDSGAVRYNMIAGFPNILGGPLHPYQKNFQVTAYVDGQTVDTIQWVLVEGNKPRASTFVSTSPEIPFNILRDPPGDGSYSYLSQGTTSNHSFKLSAQRSASANIWAEITLGTEFWKGFFSFGSETKVWGKVKGTLEVGATLMSQTEFGLSISNTDRFQTSGNSNITGAEGDVFVGAALNLVYALTDVIKWDADSCKVDQDVTIIVDNEGFATTFMYTEGHIKNTLIPQLEEIREIYSAAGSDSAQLYTNQIDVWNQTLALNDSLKEESVFIENRSFSAGAQYESTTEVAMTLTQSIEFTLWIESSIAVEAGFEESGSGLAGGFGVKIKNEFGAGYTFAHTWTTTTGFVFDDDDVGDFFSVDIKHDKVYGTPVFDLVSGRSSCPWEPGSQPRDGVSMQITPFTQNNIPPDDPAVFTLILGNTSQSGETREYNLSVDQTSNYNGAIIRVGGVVISDYLSYTIPAFQAITATMAVERGPLAYSYPNLRLEFASACDGSIDTSVTFSVNYQSPCSQVSLFRPYDNWLVNQASNDSLQIIIRDYDKSNPNLISVGFEYRKLGEGWNTAFNILKADLPADYIIRYWDLTSFPDGKYEVRAVAECGLVGMTYSSIASGTIDRNTLMVFGTPSPSDGILHLGEDISITFTGVIDCDRISSEGQLSLTRISDTTLVPINAVCSDKTIIININDTLATYENENFKARVANIYDLSGNRLKNPATWNFVVNMNPVYWLVPNASTTTYQNNQEIVTGELTNAHGTNAKSFSITKYQAWITPDVTSGQIPPGGNQTISFTISDQLNPGSYSDTVYAETTEGSESFIINVTVLSQPPAWIVTPANFQYSMNITTEVIQNGNASDDELDMICALVGNEIRGIANLQYEPAINGYLAFLTVYSNNPTGEEVTFRYWDASENIEYGGVQETVFFTNNSTVGTLLNPFSLNPTGIAQTITMNSGWNWFSTNVENTDMSLGSVLDAIDPQDGDWIRAQEKVFSAYVDGYGWIGTLNSLQTGESYQLKLTNADNLWFAGTPVNLSNTSINYVAGWNWIGYFPHENMPINAALFNLNATHGDLIKSQTEYAEYDGGSGTWIGSLQYLKPGEGYLLKTASSGSFTYPGGTTKNLKGGQNNTFKPNTGSFLVTGVPDWQVNPADYEFTMNMIGILNIRGVESADTLDIIAAFVNNECRGFAQPIYVPEMNRYQVFLTIYSNSSTGEAITYKLYDANRDEIIDADVTTTFSADDLTGSVQQPFVYEVQDLTAPGLQSAFHYSTEPGLARYIKLYISANEILANNPQVRISNSYSTQNYSTKLFDANENIYVLDYYVEEFGETNYIITAADFAGNSASDTVSLNVQTMGKITATTFAVNDLLNVTIPANQVQETGYLFTQVTKTSKTVSEYEQISDIFEFHSLKKPDNGLQLKFDLKSVQKNEEEIRKVGLYRLDEQTEEWIFIAGATDKYILNTTITVLGKYGLFYNEEFVAIPEKFMVHQNYPNPFNPITTIKYDLPEDENVSLTIFNILGQKIVTLVSQEMQAGYHKSIWNGRNENGETVTSGVYFYRLQSGKNVVNKKMVLIR